VPKKAPAFSTLPPSLAVVYREGIPKGHKWIPKSGYVQDERAEKGSCVFGTSAIPSGRIPRSHTQREQVDI